MKYMKSLFLLLCIVVCHSGCSLINSETRQYTKPLTPTPVLAPIGSALSETGDSVGSSDKNSSFFWSDLISVMPANNVDYFNYTSQTPLLFISNYIYEFSYNGIITCTNTISKEQLSFHLTDKLDVTPYLNEIVYLDNWYFMGAIQSDHYIYLHYDYLGITQLTFFIRMDLECESITVLITNPYSENEMLNCYTITNNNIYYTFLEQKEDGIKTSIAKTDLDGSHGVILCSFDPGCKIKNLYPQEDALYFIRESADGIQSLLKCSLSDSSLTVVLDNCISDFLYIHDRYILLGILNNTYLNYYSMEEKTCYNLSLLAENTGYFSVPLLLQDDLYFALHSWEDTAPTKLARLNLAKNKIETYILLSYDFKHSIGTLGADLLVEDKGEYKVINISTKQERAVY